MNENEKLGFDPKKLSVWKHKPMKTIFELLCEVSNDIYEGKTVWINYDYDDDPGLWYRDEESDAQYYVNPYIDMNELATELSKMQTKDANIIVCVQYHTEMFEDEIIYDKGILAFKD